ncbi:ATP-binding protein [Candidatus Binatus sp.]|uniref:ATP-binding protein n=1 Tax=Candidatus Binatus sp. TaxID=2811406 RepID=UPI003CADA464
MPPDRRSAGSTGVRDAGPSARVVQKGVFRKEGEYWTVGYGGNSFRLKDSKGLGYLAHLLRHPGVEFHVLDLAGGIAGQRDDDGVDQSERGLPRGYEDLEKAGIHIGSLGDAGEMLDEQAKVAYRRRLSDLREELEEAKARGNVKRAEQAEHEIDALTRELSRAIGLGGRNRRAVSASERARQSITKTIKSVLDRIAQSDAALGDIFARSIKTGNFCSYQPDLDFPIEWEFAAATVKPDQPPAPRADRAPARADHPQGPPVVLEVSPFSLAERTAFVGRESEGGAIRAVIDRSSTGHGSVVMLWDGPGVGKSRLAMEMAEYALHLGFRCSVGRCYERDEPVPYVPFAEIIESNLAQAASQDDYRRRMGDNAAELAQIAPSLRRIFPDLPKPLELPPAQQRRYLFQSVSETLARSAQTLSQLYILEDLHWADESTLALLIHLANRVGQLPVVIIGTYRDGYSDTNPALVRTLEELIRIGVRPHKLGGLSKNAVAQMLQGLSEREAPESLVSLIFEESQGYPFFVEEVYRHLTEEGKVFDAAGQFRTDLKIDEIEVPENVRLIIGRRLQRLDENEKRALAAAAVIGRSFSFRLLTAVNQMDVDELFGVIEKAQGMGIVVPSSEGPKRPFTFSHELVRQTLLAGISAPRRERLHAAVADAIERLNPDAVKERAGEISDHLLKAGSFADEQKLVRWLTLAGRSALEAAAFREARRNFQSALSHQGALDPRQRAELLASLATAERGLDLWDTVVANLREALEIYIGLDDREMIARSFTDLTDAFNWAGRFQEAIETAQRGLAYLQADVSAERARLAAALGRAYGAAGDYKPAQEALQEALNIASQLSDANLMADVLSTRSATNYAFLRLREAAADGFRSEQLAGSEASPWQRNLQLRILYLTLLFLERVEEALRIADELEPLARKIGDSYSFALCISTRAWTEFGKAPDLTKLETTLRQLKSGQKALYMFLDFSEIDQTFVDFFRGDWAAALSQAHADCRAEIRSSTEGFEEGTLFRLMAYAGDHDGAVEFLHQKRMLLPITGQPNTRGSWWMLAAVIEGLVMIGEQSQAAQFYPLVRELVGTETVVLWSIRRFTQTIAGLAAAAAHQWEAAEDHFRTAMQQAEAFPDHLEQTEIRRFHAMMLIDRAAKGDHEKAQTLLNEALQSYESIGMPRHLEMTQALLARCR